RRGLALHIAAVPQQLISSWRARRARHWKEEIVITFRHRPERGEFFVPLGLEAPECDDLHELAGLVLDPDGDKRAEGACAKIRKHKRDRHLIPGRPVARLKDGRGGVWPLEQ